MKILHITLKDLVRALRSPFVLAFMLVLPLLQAGLPYLAFGGFSQGLDVQVTRVVVTNLDQPSSEHEGFCAGTLLVDLLQSDDLADLLSAFEMDTAAQAQAAVDAREFDVAVIIPADFTTALFRDDETVSVMIYHDPALTIGPAIAREVVTNFMDGFAGSLMAADVAQAQLAAHGKTLDEAARVDVMRRYGTWIYSVGDSLERGVHPGINYQASPRAEESQSVMVALIGPIMLGMMVFFAFFVGAISAQSILREEEQGTLARLYKTPTSKAAILIGKFVAVAILLALQVTLLLSIGGLLFNIDWGDPLLLTISGLGLVLAAAGFGFMLISFMRSMRQAFIVMGGAVILTSMAGGTMTTSFTNLPYAFATINLFTPQGWVLRGFFATMHGGSLSEVALPTAVASMTGLVSLSVGLYNLNRRFS
ncbi:MAG: ABC transporter permease [Anaerolineae bacterium]|nr:ABC transporter permease [Anaerolineae bacterium]